MRKINLKLDNVLEKLDGDQKKEFKSNLDNSFLYKPLKLLSEHYPALMGSIKFSQDGNYSIPNFSAKTESMFEIFVYLAHNFPELTKLENDDDLTQEIKIWGYLEIGLLFPSLKKKHKDQILKEANCNLGKRPFLFGEKPCFADACLFTALSLLKFENEKTKLPKQVSAWMDRMCP